MISDKVNVINVKVVSGGFENYEVTVNVKEKVLHDFLNYIDKYRREVKDKNNSDILLGVLWLSVLFVSW